MRETSPPPETKPMLLADVSICQLLPTFFWGGTAVVGRFRTADRGCLLPLKNYRDCCGAAPRPAGGAKLRSWPAGPVATSLQQLSQRPQIKVQVRRTQTKMRR